jgi:hypothetical protein
MRRMLVSEECIRCRQKAKMWAMYVEARKEYEV